YNRDQLVGQVDRRFADECREESRDVRAAQSGIDRVADANPALATAQQEIEWCRYDRGDGEAGQPEGDPATGALVPAEITAQPGGKADSKGDDAIGSGHRIDRVGAEPGTDKADAA